MFELYFSDLISVLTTFRQVCFYLISALFVIQVIMVEASRIALA